MSLWLVENEIPPPPGRDVVVLVMSLHFVMAEVGDGRHV